MTFVSLLEGDVLYRRGDPAEATYLLVGGQVWMAQSFTNLIINAKRCPSPSHLPGLKLGADVS